MRFALALVLSWAGSQAAADVVSARYGDPTDRYGHAILGDAIEYGSLRMQTAEGKTFVLTLPPTHVFEDTEPRIIDIDQDGAGEVMVVETSIAQGARLAIYDTDGLVAATPYIGRTHRWLAPVGAADLDGDGHMEIAYVDRPHLAKTLRVWRFLDGRLVHIADQPGLTNHRIGERDIAGGLRVCGGVPQMITANADWTQIMASTFTGTEITSRPLGRHQNRDSFADHLTCP